ncbi:glycoside hydrolase [Basidiobolus meristosporus CBS 931.73]|uniref:chitinase n=1 Tax=Basidiobolus meristosporus CBS 931.73 TaxID=1314790 RepID=A0A1Y1Y3U2_9FUNG|nr:glycoside hydrolase [Basidiobolus meristosporus CBS 931.73]|eukprot:ORX92680.1 glycoside hydrolase [Basidiobolus meristosporus CBS 931.73]
MVSAFDEKCDTNFVTYWGQNSFGIANADRGKWERSLGSYCNDDSLDVINLSFMNIFNAGTPSPPVINLSFHCESNPFPGTSLFSCPDIGKDIEYCQSKGKKIIISLGGATGSYGFNNDADAIGFAQTVWDRFLGGSSNERPFGEAKLDGIDLDIEGGSGNGYSAFIKALRELYDKDASKKYYITGAPQCPFPDIFLGPALNDAWFDMVFVQFYNNYCSVSNPGQFNFGDWDTWATTKSINKDVKIYLGVPGAQTAASMGYLPASQLEPIIDDIRAKYPSFGGVMAWDASSSDMNVENGASFAQLIKGKLKASPKCGGQPGPSSQKPATSADQSTSPSLSSSSTTEQSSKPSPSTSTTQASEPSPVATAPSQECPVEGAPCSENETGCNGYNYASCLNGQWILRPCSTDQSLYCAKGSSGVYCDWAAGKNVQSCGAPNGLIRRRFVAEEAQVQAKENRNIMIDFVEDAADASEKEFITLLRIRSTTNSPISNAWQVKFAIPENEVVTRISRGQYTQDGSMVTLKSNPSEESDQNMAILIVVRGNIISQPRPILNNNRPGQAQFEDLGSV